MSDDTKDIVERWAKIARWTATGVSISTIRAANDLMCAYGRSDVAHLRAKLAVMHRRAQRAEALVAKHIEKVRERSPDFGYLLAVFSIEIIEGQRDEAQAQVAELIRRVGNYEALLTKLAETTDNARKDVRWLVTQLGVAHACHASQTGEDCECTQRAEAAKRLAWARVDEPTSDGPMVGDEGVRDPENPCAMFAPGEPSPGQGCQGDGHYLCRKCVALEVS